MKNKKTEFITTQQLERSGILKDFLDHIKTTAKNKKARKLWINHYLGNITAIFNNLKRHESFHDPARNYLKDLESDRRRLSQLKTHQAQIEGFRRFIELEINIAKRYIAKFRAKDKKNYFRDLVVLDWDHSLKPLKYNKRIEILSGLFIFFGLSNTICHEEKGEKQIKQYYPVGYKDNIIEIESRWVSKRTGIHKNCSYYNFGNADSAKKPICGNQDCCERESKNIQQRLSRAKRMLQKEFRTKAYKDYEKNSISRFSESIKELTAEGQGINPIFRSKPRIKKYIRNQYIKSHFHGLVKKSENRYDCLNCLEIFPILNELKIPRPEQNEIYTQLINDLDFLNAFRLPAKSSL